MNSNVVNGIIAVATAVVGLAIVAVIFSNNANTSNVITSGGNAFASIIKAAVGPVSGIGGLPQLQGSFAS